MEAWELAAVVVSLTAIFLVGVLVYVVTKLHSTISQVQKFLNRINETTIATDLHMASKSKAVEAEIQRINHLLEKAEQITKRADTHSRLVYGSFTRPVVKITKLFRGTIRAAKLFVNK
tara:strand:+ start:463 stop:816 length:354 start_codon:yes stop_codon:yes gene_type:complete